jgi:diguanylate cyclase (GGDEF)-like protein
MTSPVAGSSGAARSRAVLVLALVLLLSVATIATITLLQFRSDSSRDAELKLAGVNAALSRLQSDPYAALAIVGGSPARAKALVNADERAISTALSELQREGPPPALRTARGPLRANFAAIEQILPISASPTFATTLDPKFFPLVKSAATTSGGARRQLTRAGDEYRERSERQQIQATAGSVSTILVLFIAFALVFRRAFRARSIAEHLAAENARLAAENRHEARTDALTGLRNRRALIDDLEEQSPATGERVLALFDLDGFKHYNDTFGHPAGDGLLARLSERLQLSVASEGTAYRMGGDEFCVLATVDDVTAADLVRRAAEALSEVGDAFSIGCSYGTASIPREATSPAEALHLADQRMYEHKAGRASASRQSSDVLLKVLSERNFDLREHGTGVAALAIRTAERLGLPDSEVKRIGLGAELHDVGKTAIPDAILHKPAPLDDREWKFMRQHTAIGERILLAAPSLAPTAELVRSSHESYDGSGYPDRLRAQAIPLGSRIISVCDAYDAMLSDRAYRSAMSTDDAIAELQRCAGTQFDPVVVTVFCEIMEEDRDPADRTTPARTCFAGAPLASSAAEASPSG